MCRSSFAGESVIGVAVDPCFASRPLIPSGDKGTSAGARTVLDVGYSSRFSPPLLAHFPPAHQIFLAQTRTARVSLKLARNLAAEIPVLGQLLLGVFQAPGQVSGTGHQRRESKHEASWHETIGWMDLESGVLPPFGKGQVSSLAHPRDGIEAAARGIMPRGAAASSMQRPEGYRVRFEF